MSTSQETTTDLTATTKESQTQQNQDKLRVMVTVDYVVNYPFHETVDVLTATQILKHFSVDGELLKSCTWKNI